MTALETLRRVMTDTTTQGDLDFRIHRVIEARSVEVVEWLGAEGLSR